MNKPYGSSNMIIEFFGKISFLMVFLSAAYAGPEAGLYKSPIPAGASMARIFNAGADIPAGSAKFGEKPLRGLTTGELSSYTPIIAGARQVNCGRKSMAANFEEGKFFTFICGGPHEGTLLSDPMPEHSNKTFLILYNLSQNNALKLMTANGKLTVIDTVALKTTGSREINPVRVELSIFNGENSNIFNLGQIALSPERIYNVFVTQVAGEVRAYFRESVLDER